MATERTNWTYDYEVSCKHEQAAKTRRSEPVSQASQPLHNKRNLLLAYEKQPKVWKCSNSYVCYFLRRIRNSNCCSIIVNWIFWLLGTSVHEVFILIRVLNLISCFQLLLHTYPKKEHSALEKAKNNSLSTALQWSGDWIWKHPWKKGCCKASAMAGLLQGSQEQSEAIRLTASSLTQGINTHRLTPVNSGNL